MTTKEKAVCKTAKSIQNAKVAMGNTAKVAFPKDIDKVCDYFRYKTASTLDAALSTGVLRNSITWYVAELIELGMLQVVGVRPDTHTGRMVKYYSANPTQWNDTPKPRPRYVQLDLFGKEATE